MLDDEDFLDGDEGAAREEEGRLKIASTCSAKDPSTSSSQSKDCTAGALLVSGMERTMSAAFAISSRFGALGSAASLAFLGRALRKMTMNREVSASPGCKLRMKRRRSDGVLSPREVINNKSPALSYLFR